MLSLNSNNHTTTETTTPNRDIFGDVALRALRLKRLPKFQQQKKTTISDILTLYSLFIFAPKNRFRIFIQKITEHSYFDHGVLLVIMINSVFLAMDNPSVSNSDKHENILYMSNVIFTIIYSIELILRVIAKGFAFQEDAYLRNAWNWIDLLVVAGGIIEIVTSQNGGGLHSLRIIRLFKVLKSITLVPGMQRQVQTIFTSMPSLIAVMVLFAFLFLLFGLIGMQLFSGLLKQQCYDMTTQVFPEPNRYCSTGKWGRSCPNQQWQCLPTGQNPNSGITSFDNIFIAWLTILQIISLEGWNKIMYDVGDVTSKLSYIYFFILVLVGGFFCVNLVIAILVSNFEKESNKDRVEQLLNKQRIELNNDESFHDCMLAQCVSPSISEQHADEEDDDDNDNKNNNTTTEVQVIPHMIRARTTPDPQYILPSLPPPSQTKRHRVIDVVPLQEIPMKTMKQPLRSITTVPKPRLGFQHQPFEHEDIFKMPEKLDDDELISTCRQHLRSIVRHRWFDNFILLIIVANTVTLSYDHYGIAKDSANILELLNLCFTIVFTIELCMKFIAFGPRNYFQSKLNTFDALIVFISWIEIFVDNNNSSSGVSSLRAFRLLRVIRIIERWNSLRGLLIGFISSIKSLVPFAGILLLFLYCFAILGLNLFSGKMKTEDGQIPRSNFNSIPFSFITVFQLITRENWNEIMYNGVRNNSWLSSLYFVCVFALGNFLILNLFLAQLMDHFSTYENTSKVQNTDDDSHNNDDDDDDDDDNPTSRMHRRKKSYVPPIVERTWSYVWLKVNQNDRSFFMLSTNNPFRIVIARIVKSDMFEMTMLCIIVASCIVLAFNDTNNSAIYHINIVFTSIFMLELVMKSISYGFILHPKSYLRRDSFNIMDFFVVLIDIIWLLFGTSYSFLKVLRIFRTFRLISSLKGMRITTISLFRALPAIFNLFLMMSLLILVFGLLGVQLFKGQFYRCSDLSNRNESECHGTYQDPYMPTITLERKWRNPTQHFDHIGAATLTLFEVATLENWQRVMFNAIDISSHTDAPVRDNHPEMSLFFIVFIILCNFFMLSIIIVVIFQEFKRVKQSQENTLFLSDQQRYWIDLQRHILFTSPYIVPTRNLPNSQWTLPFFKIATSHLFDQCMNVLIVLNCIQMGIVHEGQPDEMTNILWYLDIVFTLIFIIEAWIKLSAFGFKQYFQSKWNQSDFLIVIITGAQQISLLFGGLSLVNVSFLRVFRVFRIFRFAKNFRPLKRLFQTLYLSLYALVNIGLILLILMYVYAVVGMHMFKEVRTGEYLNEYSNFRTFISSFLTMYRMLSGEDWNGLMHDCSIQAPYCTPGVNCGSKYAPVFFLSFIIIGNFIVLSLFITVILEQFSSMSKQDRYFVSHDDVELFARCWSAFSPDKQYKHTIPTSLLPILLKELPPPLGMKANSLLNETPVTSCQVLKRLIHLNIPDHNGYVHYIECLYEVSRRAIGRSAIIHEECEPIRKLNEICRKLYPHITRELDDNKRIIKRSSSKTQLMAANIYAAMLIQARWRSRQTRIRRRRQQIINQVNNHHQQRRRSSVVATSKTPPQHHRKGTIGDRVTIRTTTNRMFLTLPAKQRHRWINTDIAF